jgi:aconitase A
MARRIATSVWMLLQDLLGIPVMVDFAALREAIAEAGGDPPLQEGGSPRAIFK